MKTNFVNVDHDTILLLPPNLKEWLPANHIAHFLLDTLDKLPMNKAVVNQRGSGSPQYPPRMMLSLLLYGYVTGRFGSRSIERATYDDVAMRYLSADTHPDHDTICKFRRENKALIEETFLQVLLLAREMGFLKVGSVALDGTKIQANASKHKAMSYRRMAEQIVRLQGEVAQLLQKAEDADSTPLDEGLSIPDEISRREKRIEKLEKARRAIEDRVREEAEAERRESAKKTSVNEKDDEHPPTETPNPPEEKPADKEQYNFTDPTSRIMPKEGGKSFIQGYNAQAAVDADGSRLIVGGYLTEHTNDKQELVPGLESISKEIGTVSAAIVDKGFYSEKAVKQAEEDEQGNRTGTIVYAAVERQHHGRTIEALERKTDPPPPPDDASMIEKMRWRLSTVTGRAIYSLRKETVEPVFGIIKEAMGFRRFRLRGKEKAGIEWKLVMLAYNMKRFHNLARATNA